MDTLTSLASFRAAAYAAFSRRQDAVFELGDTLRTTGSVPSLPLLSVQPQHQRGWGRLYDALAVGEICPTRLESLLSEHPLVGGEPISAVDVSVWPGCDAETSPERGMDYHASRHWGRTTHCRRLGVFLDRASRFRARERDRPPTCASAPSTGECQCGRC
jgi:hypothetical protein